MDNDFYLESETGPSEYKRSENDGSQPTMFSLNLFKRKRKAGYSILDCRLDMEEQIQLIPGSLRIPQSTHFDQFLQIVKPLLKTPVVAITNPEHYKELTLKLNEHQIPVDGFLDGGVTAWANAHNPVEHFLYLTLDDAISMIEDGEAIGLNVKEMHTDKNVEFAENVMISNLKDRMETLNKDMTYVVCCKRDKFCRLVFSVLKSSGFNNVFILEPSL